MFRYNCGALVNESVRNMYEIKDKVILVTGGGAGIGAGVVKIFADEGAKVNIIRFYRQMFYTTKTYVRTK